ncbi:MAG: glycosyl transferase [Deltaproteobacteria bacterium]|nr:glycosyl transferase [Deltaproteobacteria bacterium]
MTDFNENGIITTLQNLVNRDATDFNRELKIISKDKNMVLLLPALVSEFDSPAMPNIIKSLMEVEYLHKIVLSLDKADESQFKKVKEIMAQLPPDVRIVWHDGPRIKTLLQELKDSDFTLGQQGKGRSVWMTMGYILADPYVDAIALHDCDILNYSKEMLARLIYPVVHPALDFEFSKGYYARVTDRLYGRVTRLFYTPLIISIKRILGYNAFIDYLSDFRYALSGEFAFVCNLARRIRISPTWGLEVSMLSEVYHMTSVNRICQVEISNTYEHKHQALEKNKPDRGLIRMATDIAMALFRVLSQDGIIISQSFFRTLLTSYMQEARIVIEKYNALSLLNGLAYDRHMEIEAIEAFIVCLKVAMEEFVKDPVGIPMLSAWVRVEAAIPDFSDRLRDAVEEDNM